MNVGGQTLTKIVTVGILLCEQDPYGGAEFIPEEATVIVIPHRRGEYPTGSGRGDANMALMDLELADFDN